MAPTIPTARIPVKYHPPFEPPLPRDGQALHWGRLHGSASALAIAAASRAQQGLTVVMTGDVRAAERLEEALRFYLGSEADELLVLPDRETLPYDVFSPHQDIVSERLRVLHRLPRLEGGLLVVPVATAMTRLPPRAWLEGSTLMLDVGERLDADALRRRLEASGYRHVSQVMEHGEYSVRGGLIDLFPMGSRQPYRIDLFDDEVESIRVFDPETQRTRCQVERIRLMPAHEFPLDEAAVTRFRQAFRAAFPGDPQRSVIYREVSNAAAPPGIEYYLPLFFEETATLFDYLPGGSRLFLSEDALEAADDFWDQVEERHEQGRHDMERPLLAPARVFLPPADLRAAVSEYPRCLFQSFELGEGGHDFASRALPRLSLPPAARHPLSPFLDFLRDFSGRILLVAETGGRREALLEMLHEAGHYPQACKDWQDFLANDARLGITVAPLSRGLLLEAPALAVITETELFGEQAMQRRRRRRARDGEAVIRNLTELHIGAPVVHEEHGVGRYLGLQTLAVGGVNTEFLTLEYADGDRLYVPVSSLHLVSRYTGASPEQAPLHKLGSGQWQRARRRAASKARDVAAELLDLYARRQARQGRVFPAPDEQYAAFAASFPFEETPDQEDAIRDVIADMTSPRPMDRLVCGDVGFGKTEVAMRAAFLAVQGGAQVAVLVPTTLLAQQHYQNFRDRFADLPVRIEALSRFRSARQQEDILRDAAAGRVDILIGTHKLLQPQVKFRNLGLVIIDEEHRFGVRQKEALKALRAEVDVLTLTATPIPRTLNMALSSIRDLSIIATPPRQRLAIKTFVREWDTALLREACQREIRRGGQVYFLHNEVRTIDRIHSELERLLPEAGIRIAHGQMPERELEQIMLDFYHQRFNILLCTTIIESGIDVPNANTIIINRADKLGLAQLYQLRGRVGRSHHQAYAYLLVPSRKAMTADAVKRLEAIESIEDLGAGFTLATHDLEIRGAGELLGEDQSGQITEIGFSMYTELLERAVNALKSGREPALDQPLHPQTEVDLNVPALIPEDYLPDVHSRLVMYKRIASAGDEDELRELQVEMIDRFGLLPEAAKNLFRITALRLRAQPLGIRKIEAGEHDGRILFEAEPAIDAARLIQLIQSQPGRYRFDGREKLRFTLDGGDLEARAAAIERLLEALGAGGEV
ncbi:MAG TPA: transcription-repair coupling factor [Gammaproteobacteria bacterium]|nr:transcription-repair coupling factor [Gammaproteobacteria bacterium]